MFSVKEAISTNEKLRNFVSQQKAVISDQSLQIERLQQAVTNSHSSLSQLHAQREHRHFDNEQLINSLQLHLHAVSRRLLFRK